MRELSERGWPGRVSLRRGCLNKDLKEAREVSPTVNGGHG